MIPANGWIKLHRQITEWQHWSSPNVLATFIHLLTMANWEDKQWQGITIQRGQLVTSIRSLSENIGIPKSTVWRVLNTLTSTGEVTVEQLGAGRSKYSLITVVNYQEYQGATEPADENTPQETGQSVGHKVGHKAGHKAGHGETQPEKESKGVDDKGVGHKAGHKVGHKAGRTKEYIRSNKNDISTTTSAHTRERNENEKKIDRGHSQVNTEEQGEKKEKNCAKKERKELGDYSGLKNSNMRVVAELKANEAWLSDTATICKVPKAEVLKKLDEFELDNTTRYKQLSLPDAFNHFQRWLRLSTDIDSRRSRTRQKTYKPTPQADKDPNAAWENPQIQALLQRNREESARQLREFRERQEQLQAQKQ